MRGGPPPLFKPQRHAKRRIRLKRERQLTGALRAHMRRRLLPLELFRTQRQFRGVAWTCARRFCPNAEVQALFTKNPARDVSTAVSPEGAAYSDLPNALK